MGVVRRKFRKEDLDLHKKLKRPLKLVAQTMRPGFTDEDFYNEFKKLQPILWNEIQDKYIAYKTLDKRRKAKGCVLRNFLSPKQLILSEAKQVLNNIRDKYRQGDFKEIEIKNARYELNREARNKVKKYRAKLELDLYYIQEINPPYIMKLIDLYYKERKKDSLNINYRLWIIQEVAKYKSDDTIRFLKQVQMGDKNENLRMTAYYALLQMHAPDVIRHRFRKGKKKKNQLMEPESIKSPKELLQAVYDADFEKFKEYDVFISHSSQNRDLIHSIVKALNVYGFNCYVDWIVDREQLNRQLTCKETAEVIVNRINQSRVFIYVLTKECIASKWSPWELGYAYAVKKPIGVLQLDSIDNKPEYLDLYVTYKKEKDIINFLISQLNTNYPEFY